ncbi:phosphoenolpyruvate synthase [Lyngbya sp. PCC 8106]|uniref:phosphoenolpyruvate synthase n=1 Tax=Lyngbya sp. (strain PCC 8106) TaxID=313612 RepID=UPI0012EA8C33|nr:phosphoenolpyruvate synthase [Lyngbya sp. PCC 8106]
MTMTQENSYIRWFESIGVNDVPIVGGKNASLGEMVKSLKSKGIRVPDGFAITAQTYWQFIEANNLQSKILYQIEQFQKGEIPLEKAGKTIRRLLVRSRFPDEIAEAIREGYRQLSDRYNLEEVDVAVRSSATAEDLPDASFAGQQESYLNITGTEEVLEACRKCYASLFTDRAISYRDTQGYNHMDVALSIVIQKMVRSDKACSGVMFSIDPETGFPNDILITASWGLGELVVQGSVTPDQYRVFKPLLKRPDLKPIIEKSLGNKQEKMIYAFGTTKTTRTVPTSLFELQSFVLDDEDILQLAKWAELIEEHYRCPMDIEWAKDGDTGELYVVQARPETVQSQKQAGTLKTYSLKQQSDRLLVGLSVGDAIASGKVCLIRNVTDIEQFTEGTILVTEMTDRDWVPIMKKAAGIVTDHGGRTCHAAIISRELGIPAIVGTGKATQLLPDGKEVTISCAEGEEGYVYEGLLEFESKEVSLLDIPQTKTKIMMNIGSPTAAFCWWQLPADGIGLARMEFLINNIIKVHPMALIHFDKITNYSIRHEISEMTHGYEDKTDYFVDLLSRGIAKISASQHPKPVIVRMSDFKTNEYADLIGGQQFEKVEANPMLGFRGASRYYSDRYREGFALECKAIKRVREVIGMDNVIIMIPFCRTLKEADRVLEVLESNGLKRGEKGLQVYVMCELPSNVELADEFAKRFDGFSIGTNDLTQLVLGVDRDSGELAELFDERDLAVKRMIQRLIKTAHEAGRKVGICGQAPSDYPDFAEFLVEAGIDSISLNPDSVVKVKRRVAEVEQNRV